MSRCCPVRIDKSAEAPTGVLFNLLCVQKVRGVDEETLVRSKEVPLFSQRNLSSNRIEVLASVYFAKTKETGCD